MRENFNRYLIFIFGLLIVGMGVTLTVKSDIGAGSYDSINFALAKIFNLNVSITIAITSLIALILASIIRGEAPRITTFITAALFGLFVDLWVNVFESISLNTTISKILVFFIGIIILSFGIALYLLPQLPANPVDDLMIAISEEKKIKLGTSKLIIDVVCILVAFLLKGPIGIGTIVLTFLVGPIVNIFYNYIKKYIVLNKAIN